MEGHWYHGLEVFGCIDTQLKTTKLRVVCNMLAIFTTQLVLLQDAIEGETVGLTTKTVLQTWNTYSTTERHRLCNVKICSNRTATYGTVHWTTLVGTTISCILSQDSSLTSFTYKQLLTPPPLCESYTTSASHIHKACILYRCHLPLLKPVTSASIGVNPPSSSSCNNRS